MQPGGGASDPHATSAVYIDATEAHALWRASRSSVSDETPIEMRKTDSFGETRLVLHVPSSS